MLKADNADNMKYFSKKKDGEKYLLNDIAHWMCNKFPYLEHFSLFLMGDVQYIIYKHAHWVI